MVVYYRTEGGSGALLSEVLQRIGAEGELLRTPNGKPYLGAKEAELGVTDTVGFSAVAVSAQAVGLDAERRIPRRLDAILSRLTPAEREEDFFELWTAKEAYVKYLGGTLARFLPRLTYEKGALRLDGAPTGCHIKHFELCGCVLCVCTAETEEISFEEL